MELLDATANRTLKLDPEARGRQHEAAHAEQSMFEEIPYFTYSNTAMRMVSGH